MNAAIPLSDDELRAPGEALCYVKEALADMALSSIRRGTAVMLLHCRRRSLCLYAADRPFSLFKLFGLCFFLVCRLRNVTWECINETCCRKKSFFWASFRVIPLCNLLSSHRYDVAISALQFSCFAQTAKSRSQLKCHLGSHIHTSSQKPSRAP